MMRGARGVLPRSVFLDSSVLVAAAISRTGSARDLLREHIRGRLDLRISQLVLDETARNLARKAPEALDDFRTLVAVLDAQVVSPTAAVIAEAASITADKDAPIISAAVQARARFLATYDRQHLLRFARQIEERFGVCVATPADILDEI